MIDSAFRYMSNAYGKNHYEVDFPFRTILKYFGFNEDLSSLGGFAGGDLYEIADYVDKVAKPRQVHWSINGERVDRVWLEPAERFALERLIREFEVNRRPIRNRDWFHYFASIYLIGDPGISCILTVTNQTAFAIQKYGSDETRKLLPSLIGEGGEIKLGATWFTELQGGSDLGANLVQADEERGGWVLNGDTKYFSSNAGLADFALVTARPKGAKSGAKGIALFLVPATNSAGKKNFSVRRLKDKSGTVSVPTGEVEFSNSEAHLLGDADKGIYYTMENLMVSRLSNAVGALGIARKAYLEAYYYAKNRSAFGKKLIEHPLATRDLIEMESYIEGTMLLTFKAIDLFQKYCMDTYPYSEGYHFARLLTHISKNLTADMASHVTKLAMELHGGVGFLTEFAVERWHREALITPIWEGPSNIQALDMLEVIVKKKAHLSMLNDIDELGKAVSKGRGLFEEGRKAIVSSFSSLAGMGERESQFHAKETLERVGHAYATLMLLHLGNAMDSERFIDVATIYNDRFVRGSGIDSNALETASRIINIDEVEMVVKK
ncbi:MAG: acyl-CoA dehydrogenase family protein [Conexivisphaerales archaeon]